jgi:hypothetical protein
MVADAVLEKEYVILIFLMVPLLTLTQKGQPSQPSLRSGLLMERSH